MIHAQFGPDGLEILPLARSLGVPLLVTFHGYDASSLLRSPDYKAKIRDMLDYAKGIVVSDAVRRHLISAGMPSERLEMHYIGVPIMDFPFISRIPPTEKMASGEEVILLQVGRFVEKKAQAIAIKAFSVAIRRYPNLRLRLIGEGPLKAACERLALELDVRHAVTFLCALDSAGVAKEMARADAYLHHSVTSQDGDSEGLPISILEAMASGLPVAGSLHSGIPEAVVDGVTGHLVAEGDVDGFAESIFQVLSRNESFGLNGRRLVEERFDDADQNARLSDLYRRSIEVEGPDKVPLALSERPFQQSLAPTWLELRVDPVPLEEARCSDFGGLIATPSPSAERTGLTERAPPIVTLGIPIYNGAQYLEASLDSLLAQTFGNFEVLISDNGSDDGTEEICRRYAAMDRRIRYMRHEVNRGAAWNHNFLIAEARGRFFRWHHADDLCEPSYLERCVAALEVDPDVVLAYPKTMLIDAAGRVTEHYDDRLALCEETPHARLRHLLANVFLCNPVLGLMRLDVLRRTALLGSYLRSDHVLLAELAMAGRWAEVPEPLFYRRIHAGKSTAAHRSLQERAAWLDPRLRNKKFFWPNLRLFVERLRAVRRAPVGWLDRLLCTWTVIAWQAGFEVRQLRTRLVRVRNRLATWAGAQAGRGGVLGEPAPQTAPRDRGGSAG